MILPTISQVLTLKGAYTSGYAVLAATAVSTVAKDGFETSISIDATTYPYARIAALDVSGDVLGSTATVNVVSGVVTAADGPIIPSN